MRETAYSTRREKKAQIFFKIPAAPRCVVRDVRKQRTAFGARKKDKYFVNSRPRPAALCAMSVKE